MIRGQLAARGREPDTGTAAGQVHGSALALLNESNRLTGEVEQFLAKVRAA